ncbi:hypothetical protein BDR26DRAFT_533637 [Obelidium mucronatum]|nr:hypothetical protein BDR26DRAFT_533637 [Obelidium mucronatum]
MTHVVETDWELQNTATLGLSTDSISSHFVLKTARHGGEHVDSWDEDAIRARRQVVFATDGSENASRALAWGLGNLVDASRDLVVIVSVGLMELGVEDVLINAADKLFQFPLWNSRAPAVSPELTAKKLFALRNARSALEHAEGQIIEAFAGNETTLFYQLIGLASDDVEGALIGFVKGGNKRNALLIVGSRGLGTVQRLSVGSTTDHLLHHLTDGCTVVVVK